MQGTLIEIAGPATRPVSRRRYPRQRSEEQDFVPARDNSVRTNLGTSSIG